MKSQTENMKTYNPRKRSTHEIIADLRKHLASEDGRANDDETDNLFREWHSVSGSEETDLEEVEAWAFAMLN